MSGRIDVFEKVLCAARQLKRNTILSEGDVDVRKINTAKKRGVFVKEFSLIKGKLSKMPLSKGDPLQLNKFENPPLIYKGDIVKIIAKKDQLLIVASGISKEDGYANQQVRVENLSSGKIIRGTVKGKSRVEVVY